jgi:hypothetical protein
MGDAEWDEKHDSLRDYVEEHHAFPSPSKPVQKILAGWWTSQRRAQRSGRLTAEQGAKLDQLAKFVQDAKDALRTGRTAEGLRRDRRQILVHRAREALTSPYLIDGDVEVLKLRVYNPDAEMADLAAYLGMTVPAYRGKLYAAMKRTPNSYQPPAVRRPPVYFRGRAAAVMRIKPYDFDQLVKHSHLFTELPRNGPSGWGAYLVTEVHEAREKLAETVLSLMPQFEALGRRSLTEESGESCGQ